MKKIIKITGILIMIAACRVDYPVSVTVSADKSVLTVGETIQLKVSVVPENGRYLYASSDSGIASVSETGLVKAVSPGTVNIGAGAGDVFDQMTFSVVESASSYTDFIITPETTEWEVGLSVPFSLTYLPLTQAAPTTDMIAWKSENPAVAEFSGNILNLLSTGSTGVWAEITVDGESFRSNIIEVVLTDEIVIGSEIYVPVKEIRFNEGVVTQVWPKTTDSLYSVDSETGVLTHRGGNTISGTNAEATGNDYNANIPGAGANSWLVWTLPDGINPVDYDYIEIDLKRISSDRLNGYSIILNHQQPYPGDENRAGGISYEMVHFNNVSSNQYGWFISYGGMWQNVGKGKKFHAGVGRAHPRDLEGTIHFGMKLSDGPQKVSLYYNRTNEVIYDSYNGSDKAEAPLTWTENGSTVFEFIYSNTEASNCSVAIEALRLYNRKSQAQPD